MSAVTRVIPHKEFAPPWAHSIEPFQQETTTLKNASLCVDAKPTAERRFCELRTRCAARSASNWFVSTKQRCYVADGILTALHAGRVCFSQHIFCEASICLFCCVSRCLWPPQDWIPGTRVGRALCWSFWRSPSWSTYCNSSVHPCKETEQDPLAGVPGHSEMPPQPL